jgi:orotidine-5'-phosphate decarboxylase
MRKMVEMDAKDRLMVALDVPTAEEARRLVSKLGDAVSVYKVGLELLFAGGLSFARELKGAGKAVFLDMKLLDIANTVEHAVANVAELGFDFLTIHGQDAKTLRAAAAGRGKSRLKLLAVTVLTNLTVDDLAQQGIARSPADLVLARARIAREAGCDGVISSGQEAAQVRRDVGPDFLIVTPGIRLPGGTTDDQARVMTPDSAIAAGADYLVVGRPITRADDPKVMAQAFTRHIAEAADRRRLV